jgi:hypothetical protein
MLTPKVTETARGSAHPNTALLYSAGLGEGMGRGNASAALGAAHSHLYRQHKAAAGTSIGKRG